MCGGVLWRNKCEIDAYEWVGRRIVPMWMGDVGLHGTEK